MNDLKKRKGFTIVSEDIFRGDYMNLQLLKAMYSVFYPIAMDSLHTQYPYDTLKLYGYSELFEVCEEGQGFPEYKFTFFRKKDGSIIVEKVEIKK